MLSSKQLYTDDYNKHPVLQIPASKIQFVSFFPPLQLSLDFFLGIFSLVVSEMNLWGKLYEVFDLNCTIHYT